MDRIIFMPYHEFNEKKEKIEQKVVEPVIKEGLAGYPYREFLSLVYDESANIDFGKIYYRHKNKFKYLLGLNEVIPENSFFMDEIEFDKTQFFISLINLINDSYGKEETVIILNINIYDK